jgi:two-component system, NarL family, nitrate/nitrite response regulator NarL
MPVPMVGRAAALDELRRAWARVAERRTGIPVVITGDAGTGKTTLATAAIEAVRPALVLAGTARVHSPAPYDWLAAVLAGRDRSRIRVPADALAWLAQDPGLPRQRYAPDALLRLAVTVVRDLVGAGPAVLLVDDLHALDPASLNLIAELAAADLPVLLLVASRPPEDDLVARTLARLTGAVRQHLGPLAPDQVGEVLRHVYADRPPPAELAEAVWRRTGGNPYRLTELIAVEGAAGPAALGGPAAAAGPELTAREREVLGCLAEGMANKQIAAALGISVRTVTVHVSNLLRKTGAASRTEAALLAVRTTARAGS